MKIDWKHLATTPGYKSLKAAHIKKMQENNTTIQKGRKPMRGNEYWKNQFNWVISRAKHYASQENCTIEEILNNWEEKRDCGILNYYGDSRQPRMINYKRKPLGIRGMRKYLKRISLSMPVIRKKPGSV